MKNNKIQVSISRLRLVIKPLNLQKISFSLPEFLSGGLATSCFLLTIMTNLPSHISKLSPLQVRCKFASRPFVNGREMGLTWESHGSYMGGRG